MSHALQYGLLPAITSADSPKEYLKSYITTYLREEVLQEGLTRSLDTFSHFLETASFSQGEVLSFSEVAREVAVDRKTVTNYFEIVEDLLIGSRLSVFSKKAKRDMGVHPKFYFFDVGVYRAIRPRGPLDSIQEGDGSALETLFLQEAKAINDYFDLGYSFYYWRTRSKVEVDFILYGERGLHAFEIKRKARLNNNDFKGLKLFGKDYPMAKLHMIYGGSREGYEGDIVLHPVRDFFPGLKDVL